MFGQESPRGEVVFAFVASAVQAKERDADSAIFAQFDGLLEQGAEARGVAVGRKAHDFVLISVEVESEMQGDHGIKNTDGIAGGDFLQFF